MHLLLPALLLLSANASAQQAQGLDAHGFRLAPHDGDLRDSLVLDRPGALTLGDAFASGLAEYANAPLVRVIAPENGGEGQRTNVLDHVVAMNLSAGVALHERLRLSATAPVFLTSTGLDLRRPGRDRFTQGPTMGDTRVSLQALAVRPRNVQGSPGGLGLGGSLYLDAPSGNPDRLLGQPGVAGGGSWGISYEFERATLSGQAGLQFNPAAGLSNLSNSDSVQLAAAANVLVSDRTALNLDIIAAPPLKANAVKGAGFPSEALLSIRHRTPTDVFITLGGAAGLTQGAGVAAARAFLGLGYSHIHGPRKAQHDPLGMFTISDDCPLEYEVFNNWKDDDGCPDDIGRLNIDVRRDGQPLVADLVIAGPDGVEQTTITRQGVQLDAYPETEWSFEATAAGGCLYGRAHTVAAEGGTQLSIVVSPRLEAQLSVLVQDAKGVMLPSATVQLQVDEPACLPELLPPMVDEFGLWAITLGGGDLQLSVTAPGYSVFNQAIHLGPREDRLVEVTLATARVVIEKKRIRITDKVHFQTGKAVIKPDSFGLLDEVADIIITNPAVGQIEVAGHTDAKGSDPFNLKLSQSRANSVRRYLIAQGVAAERLLAVGYGETKPIDTNRTPEGREANRRVEFVLVDQPDDDPAPEAP